MTLQQLKDLIASNEIDKLKPVLEINYSVDAITKALREYDPKQHDVHDLAIRRDTPIKNDKNETVGTYKKNRISVPMEQNIVMLRAAFIGNPVMEAANGTDLENELLRVLQKIEKDNKLEYKFNDIAKKTMSELGCAELWYSQEADANYWKGYNVKGKRKFRMKLLHHLPDPITQSGGDALYPVYDDYGDMIAFGRGYKRKDGDKEIEHLDIYTSDRFYFLTKSEGEWISNVWDQNLPELMVMGIEADGMPGVPNFVGKIPVMYYPQPITEWHHVSEMIRRIETKLSNHSDTNDAFDAPIFFAKGKMIGFGDRGETGKILEAEADADAKYLTWDSAPESTKMELENLFRLINKYTQTPDISFDNMKSLGSFSKIALDMFFIEARLKANEKRMLFGEIVQRRYNYLKKAVATMDSSYEAALSFEITPKFEYFMPENDAEKIDNAVKMYQAGGISQETFVKGLPGVQDAEAELKLIGKEQQEKQKNDVAKAKEMASITKPFVAVN